MFLLRFTQPIREGLGYRDTAPQGPWYLQRLGAMWPAHPERRLIDATTLDPKQAKQFPTEEDARSCWVTTGSGRGWEVVEIPK